MHLGTESKIPTSVRIPEESKQLLEALAQYSGKTVSALVIELLDEGIKRRIDPEKIEKLVEDFRQRKLREAEQLRNLLPGLSSD